MNNQESILLAQQLLDSEFSEVNNKPVEFCEAMGWESTSSCTIKAIIKMDKLAPSKKDVLNLSQIIQGLRISGTIEIFECNSVSDFIVNTIASHIIY